MTLTHIIQNLRAYLKQSRSAAGILPLRELPIGEDSEGKGLLTWSQFNNALSKCGIPSRDLRELFLDARRGNGDYVVINDFMQKIKGSVSPQRRQKIDELFHLIDVDGDGTVSVSDILEVFSPSNHPDVKAGRRSANKVLAQMADALHTASPSGYFNSLQFMVFFSDIVALDDEADFAESLHKLWDVGELISGGDNFISMGYSDVHFGQTSREKSGDSKVAVDKIMNRLLSLFKSRSIKGIISLIHAFRKYDTSSSGFVNASLFRRAFKEALFSPPLSHDDVSKLFYYYDSSKNGSVNYIQFLNDARGTPTAAILTLARSIFDALDSTHIGSVHFDELLRNYCPAKHPDVLSGLRTAAVEYRDFLETFDYGADISGRVSKTEFLEYVCNLNAATGSDKIVELILRNTWNFPMEKESFMRSDGNGPKFSNSEEQFAAQSSLRYLTSEDIINRYKKTNEGMDGVRNGGDQDWDEDSHIPDDIASYNVSQLILFIRKDLALIGKVGYFNFLRSLRNGCELVEGVEVLSRSVFLSIMQKQFGSLLTVAEYVFLFNSIAGQGPRESGVAPISKLVTLLRPQLSARTLAVVTLAFDTLDIHHEGAVDASIVASHYCPTQHPDVVLGMLSAEDEFREFLETFDVGADIPGKVTRKEFVDYYTSLGAIVDNENKFMDIVQGVWNIRLHKPSVPPSQVVRETAPPASPKAHSSAAQVGVGLLLENIRNELKARGRQAMIALQRSLRAADPDDTQTVTFGQLKYCLQQNDFRILDTELKRIFDYADGDNLGRIGASEFMALVVPPLSPFRAALVDLVFFSLPNAVTRVVDPRDVIARYDATKHPDVLSGTVREDDCRREFLSTFDVGGEVPGKVTMQEFVWYHTTLSAVIDNDEYFEYLVRNVWRVYEELPSPSRDESRYMDRHESIADMTRSKVDPRLEKWLPDDNRRFAAKNKLLASSQSIFTGYDDLDLPEAPPKQSKAPFRDLHATSMVNERSLKNGSTRVSMDYPSQEPSVAAQAALLNLRAELRRNGIYGFANLYRKLKETPRMPKDLFTLKRFLAVLQELYMLGSVVTEEQVRELFAHMDPSFTGYANIHDMMKKLGCELSTSRYTIVSIAFDAMDKSNRGIIDAKMMAQEFDADRHPDVISGQKSANDVFHEFLETFHVGEEHPGKVTKKEFMEYYSHLNGAIASDEYFERLIKGVWLHEDAPAQMHPPSDDSSLARQPTRTGPPRIPPASLSLSPELPKKEPSISRKQYFDHSIMPSSALQIPIRQSADEGLFRNVDYRRASRSTLSNDYLFSRPIPEEPSTRTSKKMVGLQNNSSSDWSDAAPVTRHGKRSIYQRPSSGILS